MESLEAGRVLMVVDVQRGFVVPETAHVAARITARMPELRDRYGLLVATRFVNRPGSLYATERDWHEMMDGPSTEVLPEILAVADRVVTKHGLAPNRDDVIPLLRERAIRGVDLCGFDTDQCVLATALLLWDAGIAPRLLSNLCASSGGAGMHEVGLAMARRSIGDRNVVPASDGRPAGARR